MQGGAPQASGGDGAGAGAGGGSGGEVRRHWVEGAALVSHEGQAEQKSGQSRDIEGRVLEQLWAFGWTAGYTDRQPGWGGQQYGVRHPRPSGAAWG